MTDERCSDEQRALVFLETSGNQAYLFATNKLKENVGASQLTYLAGAQWVREAAAQVGGTCIQATSGKALVRVPSRAQGKKLIGLVTARALREAPGMRIAGAVADLAQGPKAALEELHRRFDANRETLDALRFPTLPWAEPCATSGLAAVGQRAEAQGKPELWLSAESCAKRDRASEWVERINRILAKGAKEAGDPPLKIQNNIDDLQADFADSQWLGLVCSDGNGLGQIFMDLDRHLEALRRQGGQQWDHLDTMERFSTELEEATQRAFYVACAHIATLREEKEKGKRTDPRTVPVIPVLVGGDDVATIVDGAHALGFARRFLTAFEEETERCPTIAKIAQVALGAPRLSAGAGVALIKHHFPFHLAHDLAESLLKSSKEAKKEVRIELTDWKGPRIAPYPVSSLDFHVLFDASFTDLDSIRKQRLTVTGSDGTECRLYGGPYVVTSRDRLKDAPATDPDWAEDHRFERLIEQFDLLNAQDQDGRACLPSSQMHALREAAAQGRPSADARLREMGWLMERGLAKLVGSNGSLFHPVGEPKVLATRFVDAINGAAFWPEPDARPRDPEENSYD